MITDFLENVNQNYINLHVFYSSLLHPSPKNSSNGAGMIGQ